MERKYHSVMFDATLIVALVVIIAGLYFVAGM